MAYEEVRLTVQQEINDAEKILDRHHQQPCPHSDVAIRIVTALVDRKRLFLKQLKSHQ